MQLKLVPFVQLIALTTAAIIKTRAPQVYEDIEETPLSTWGRTVLQPSKFDMFATPQPDQQRWRYFLQQQADAMNRSRRKNKSRKREVQIHEHNLLAPIYLVPKAVNFGLDHVENLKQLHESFGGVQQEQDIEALSALIGQAPMAQLEGLQQLLTKDHTPITEHVIDVVNPQNRPNIKVEPAPPEYQQAVANVHVLQADAQRKAKQQNFALVDAQQVYGGINYRPQMEEQKTESTQIYEENKDSQYASQYAFGYRVRDNQSGSNFGHEEIHDGKMAKGQYHVHLPDGRLQRVQYWADETGFHAKVTYEGLAQH